MKRCFLHCLAERFSNLVGHLSSSALRFASALRPLAACPFTDRRAECASLLLANTAPAHTLALMRASTPPRQHLPLLPTATLHSPEPTTIDTFRFSSPCLGN